MKIGRIRKSGKSLPTLPFPVFSIALSGTALLVIAGILLLSFADLSRQKDHLDHRLKTGVQIQEILGASGTSFELLLSNDTGVPVSEGLPSGWSSQIGSEVETLRKLPFPWTSSDRILLAQLEGAWTRFFQSPGLSRSHPIQPLAHTLILTHRALQRRLAEVMHRTEGHRRILRAKLEGVEAGILGSSLVGILLFSFSVLLARKLTLAFDHEQKISASLTFKTALFQSLIRISRILQSRQAEPPPLVFQEILKELAQSLDIPDSCVGIVSQEVPQYQILSSFGSFTGCLEGAPLNGTGGPEEEGLLERTLRSGNPQISGDIFSDPQWSPLENEFLSGGPRCGMADSAVTTDGKIIVLVFILGEGRESLPEIVGLLSGLVEDLASFINHQRVEEERFRLASYHEAIHEIQQDLLKNRSPGEMYGHLSQILVNKARLDRACVFSPGKGSGELNLEASSWKDDSLSKSEKSKKISGNSEKNDPEGKAIVDAFLERKIVGPVKIADESFPGIDQKHGSGVPETPSMIACPVLLPEKDEPAAVLVVWEHVPHDFTSHLLRLLSQIVQSLSLALERTGRILENERLSLILQKTTDCIVISDADTKVLWVNRAFEEKFGYPLPEIAGLFPGEFRVGPETDLKAIESIRQLEREGRSFEKTLLFYSRNGNPFWMRINATALKGLDGSHDGYVSLETDVTQLKDSEEQARLSTLFYKALSETIRDLRQPSEKNTSEILSYCLDHLAKNLDSPLIILGSFSGLDKEVHLLSGTGPVAEMMEGWDRAVDLSKTGGQDPLGDSLRTGTPRFLRLGDPSTPALFREKALRLGLSGSLLATITRVNGDKIVLWAHFSEEKLVNRNGADLFEKIAGEISDFLDRTESTRLNKVERYHSVQLAIQTDFLSARTDEQVYRILADSLCSEPGVMAVDVLVPDEGRFVRSALMGPFASIIARHPLPLFPGSWEGDSPSFPARVYHDRAPIRIENPGNDPSMAGIWKTVPFRNAGLLAGWPIPGPSPSDPPVAVVMMIGETARNFSDNIVFDLMRDVTESAAVAIGRIRSLQRMEDLSIHDPLTGLLNRRGLDLSLASFLKDLDRHSGVGVLGVLDLDDFKPVNDIWGHTAGDFLLVEVGKRLGSLLRGNDIVARLGGDEFAIVMELSNRESLFPVLDRMDRMVSAPYFLPDVSAEGVRIGLSMGLVFYPGGGKKPDQLLKNADLALYQIKKEKGHRSRWWTLWQKPPEKNGKPGRLN